ncbi:protein tyrosine phosphatase family protein [Pantanalinema sp. GBBB05]|uniref:protein tyrosine phosphatase family protein n=1 Tax=Pantanalinema sp. GBBB05 TaxID=2604139 RepID=UPI001D6C771A|nr:phosphatase [Pantanalinema sp. GBBB05]
MAVDDIYNFLQLTETIGTAGQPTVEQFSDIQAAGYQVIINLAIPTSPKALPQEANLVAELGLKYIAIPVEWEHPSLTDVQQFFAAMQANWGQKLFVHCIANMRVSAFMYLYRVICEGMKPEQAQPDLHRIWTPNFTWQQLIEQLIERYQSLHSANSPDSTEFHC